MHQKEIKTYYDHLACTYDKDRFNNTYGQYIDAQERNFLTSFLIKTRDLKPFWIWDAEPDAFCLLQQMA